MTCRVLQQVCKTEAEVKRWGFDFVRDPETGALGFLANAWKPRQIYAANARTLPTQAGTGLQYRGSGGQSGSREPAWPETVGGTVKDGSITHTAEAISNDSVRAAIVTSVWVASDASITIADEQIENTGGKQAVSALIGGGAAGETYEVKNTITLSDGAVEVSIIEVSVV